MKILFINCKAGGGVKTYIDGLKEYMSLNHTVENYVYNNKINPGRNYFTKKIYNLINIIYPFYLKQEIKAKLIQFDPDAIHFNSCNVSAAPILLNEIKKWKNQTKKNSSVVYTAHNYELICLTHDLYNSKKNKICEKCIKGNQSDCIKEKCLSANFFFSILYYLSALYWRKISNSYKVFDKIICCSQFVKSKIDKEKKFADKTVFIQNFAKTEKNNLKNKKDYVVYFGRYTKIKGIKTLLNAIKDLNINFAFIGAGPLEKDIEEISNIKNYGLKSGTELKDLVSHALFSIIPSEWYENCPFSVIESQMWGTPVLGANIGGIPELIIAGKTGELFESGNAEDLRNHIEKMYNNPEKLKIYSENCLNKKFNSIEVYCELLSEIYKKQNEKIC